MMIPLTQCHTHTDYILCNHTNNPMMLHQLSHVSMTHIILHPRVCQCDVCPTCVCQSNLPNPAHSVIVIFYIDCLLWCNSLCVSHMRSFHHCNINPYIDTLYPEIGVIDIPLPYTHASVRPAPPVCHSLYILLQFFICVINTRVTIPCSSTTLFYLCLVNYVSLIS